MAMNLAQMDQMISWLDEERRKDKDEMNRLRQRLEEQLQGSEQWIRKVQELEGRLAKAQTQLMKMGQLEQSIENLKIELVALVEKVDQKSVAAQRDSERARLSEREAQNRAITEIRKQLEALPRLSEQLDSRYAEEQRLNRAVLELRAKIMEVQEDFDEKIHRLPVLEEQRANDVKRIAQLEETSTELLRRAESQTSKAELFEDGLRKAEQQIGDLRTTREDLRGQQMQFMEEQQLREQQRKRQLDEWGTQLQGFEREMAEMSAAAKVYKDFYDKNRHALEGLERLQTHLMQRQAELAEMQRLSEERQKKQLQEWKEENEKRWKREALESEHAWAEQMRKNEAAVKRLETLEGEIPPINAELATLWDEMAKTVSAQLDSLHGRQKDLDEISASRRKKNNGRSTK